MDYFFTGLLLTAPAILDHRQTQLKALLMPASDWLALVTVYIEID